jgi:flagellar protein FlaJ
MPSRIDNIFKRFDTSLSDYTSVKKADDETERDLTTVPHVIRLPKGAFPAPEKLTYWQKVCRNLMGDFVEKFAKYNPTLEENLIKAQMGIRYEDYIAVIWMNTIVAAAIWIGASIILGALTAIMGWPSSIWLMLTILLAMLPMVVYAFTYMAPGMKAKARRTNIDKRISYSMSFIAAMASADVNIDVIFKELARQPIYGEIQKEAQWITRDIDLMGVDVLTALSDAASRTPSEKFQDFLQGVVTTSRSGGKMKPFFVMKADQYAKERRLEEKKLIETLGVLAESFVTVVVAAPLFLIVMISLMATVGGGGGTNYITFLYAIVFGMIPGSQIAFIILIQSMTEEV